MGTTTTDKVTAYSLVRMRVKAGGEKEFLDLFKTMTDTTARMKGRGYRRGGLVKTGDRSYCIVGEWESIDGLAASRPDMIKELDRMRNLLEDLGGGLGVTDPVSGELIAELA